MAQSPQSTAQTIIAGGCFWCVESDMEKLPGVIDVVSGYAGGSRPNPTYENYHDLDDRWTVPHIEVVQVTYDPQKLSYEALLDYFLRHIDPTDGGGQFCDRGPAYRPAIFVHGPDQESAAKARLEAAAHLLKTSIHVDILPDAAFWPAEDYHQDYHRKNPLRYGFYRANCGRDRRVKQLWGKISG